MKARSTDDLSHENLSPIDFKWVEWCERLCLSFRNVAVLVVVFCFEHGLTPDLSSLFKNGQNVLLFILFFLFFECSMLLPEYVFFFFFCVLSVCSFMHAPCHYFSIGVKNFPPRQHVSLPWTSIAGTCTTWQRIASSTMRDSTKHDFRAHIVDLFHTKKKKKSERGGKENPPASLKWNGLISKIRGLSEGWEMICTGLLLNYICRQGQSVFATLFTRLDTP